MQHAMFHLSFPVNNLDQARSFYVDTLGCTPGRIREKWMDIYFFGHQLTLHEAPEQVLSIEASGVRHFGIVLDWDAWVGFGALLEDAGLEPESPATVKYKDTQREQGKILLRDPSGNLIEIKAYRNPPAALELSATAI